MCAEHVLWLNCPLYDTLYFLLTRSLQSVVDERQKARMDKYKLGLRSRKPIECLGVRMYASISVLPNTVICHICTVFWYRYRY